MNKNYNSFFLLLCLFLLAFQSCNNNRNISWATKEKNTPLKNFYKLNDSLFRAKQPYKDGMRYLEKNGFKSVLNLRNDKNDSAYLENNMLACYNIKINTKNFTDAEIVAALKILKIAPKPLLVHCKHGADRTGVVMAMYRIVFENWTKEAALEELQKGKYGFHKKYKNIPAYIFIVDIEKIKGMMK
jgi:tyrosine-protein phosphatase SIW14